MWNIAQNKDHHLTDKHNLTDVELYIVRSPGTRSELMVLYMMDKWWEGSFFHINILSILVNWACSFPQQLHIFLQSFCAMKHTEYHLRDSCQLK